jgi:hypothetical protein
MRKNKVLYLKETGTEFKIGKKNIDFNILFYKYNEDRSMVCVNVDGTTYENVQIVKEYIDRFEMSDQEREQMQDKEINQNMISPMPLRVHRKENE